MLGCKVLMRSRSSLKARRKLLKALGNAVNSFVVESVARALIETKPLVGDFLCHEVGAGEVS